MAALWSAAVAGPTYYRIYTSPTKCNNYRLTTTTTFEQGECKELELVWISALRERVYYQVDGTSCQNSSTQEFVAAGNATRPMLRQYKDKDCIHETGQVL